MCYISVVLAFPFDTASKNMSSNEWALNFWVKYNTEYMYCGISYLAQIKPICSEGNRVFFSRKSKIEGRMYTYLCLNEAISCCLVENMTDSMYLYLIEAGPL